VNVKIAFRHSRGKSIEKSHMGRQRQSRIYLEISISCGVRDKIKEAPFSFLHGCRKRTKGLIALTPEIDCNKTAMGLTPVTSAVFLIAN
jgi:hypothetical protein